MIDVKELDIFYLSYDEPKKEEFWADLLDKCPWAKRVDGITGFDSAHKECANQSETPFLITVDGDNKISTNFFDQELELVENTVISYDSLNHTNGLTYGNGGIKIWCKNYLLNMQSHENAVDEQSQIDFCWEDSYKHEHDIFSITYTNQTPYQSFRSGLREGVKLSLNRGLKVKNDEFTKVIYPQNLKNLMIWSSVGSDVENGLWGIYGCRLGMRLTNIDDWDISNIRDYDWTKMFWEEEISKLTEDDLHKGIVELGNVLSEALNVPMPKYDEEESKFIKDYALNGLIHKKRLVNV